jgi:hypothetical protein
MAATEKLAVLWNVTPCSSVPTFRRDMLPPSSVLKMQRCGESSQLYIECMTSLVPTRLFSARLLVFPSLCVADCLFMGGRVSVAKLQTANGFISEKAEGFFNLSFR